MACRLRYSFFCIACRFGDRTRRSCEGKPSAGQLDLEGTQSPCSDRDPVAGVLPYPKLAVYPRWRRRRQRQSGCFLRGRGTGSLHHCVYGPARLVSEGDIKFLEAKAPPNKSFIRVPEVSKPTQGMVINDHAKRMSIPIRSELGNCPNGCKALLFCGQIVLLHLCKCTTCISYDALGALFH